MKQYQKEFLSLMCLALGNTEARENTPGDIAWNDIFRLAEQHHVLPMIVDTAYRKYGERIPSEYLTLYKKRAQRMIYLQATKTERFLTLYRFLIKKELHPLVVKGLICRDLYPVPDYRFSADEDLFIPADEVILYHNALVEYGMKTDSMEQSIACSQEISYKSNDGVLLLELHRFLFPPDSGAYGDYNIYFKDAFRRSVTERTAGIDVTVMDPTDHLFYLICHAVKHFLHGGCGIRQVCDIGLYARKKECIIDWARLTMQIDSIHVREFTESLFAIAADYLSIHLTELPDYFHTAENNAGALLDDILESGIYGSSTMNRKHSATITLRAAEEFKSTSTGKSISYTRTLFPALDSLKMRYPYLITRPWLLPFAWAQRACSYIKTYDTSNSPFEAIRIGKQRVALMEQYGLVAEESLKQVDTGQYLTALCELIDQGHEVSIPVAGSSMTPFVGDGRDQIFVKSPWRSIRRGDIVLYRRLNGDYVLHRIYRVHGSAGSEIYDIIGDSQNRLEHGIKRDQIFALATRARRKGKIIKPGCFYWLFFQYIWIRVIPARRVLIHIYTGINRWKEQQTNLHRRRKVK